MKANTPELMKFKRLQRRLNETRRGIIGLLESMWIEVCRNCPEGDIGRFSNEEIAIMVDWNGDSDFLVNALVECSWLDRCSKNRLVVHDWSDHCPTYVKGGLAKKGKDIAIAISSEVIPKVQAIATSLDSSATSSEVSSTYSIQFNSSQANSSQASSDSAQKPPKQETFDASSCVFPIFPTSGKHKTWEAKPEQISEWAKCYPGINIDLEHRKAHSWVMANISKRKTKDGMPKFLNGWFSRAQDKIQSNSGKSVSPGITHQTNFASIGEM
jgi:hypothetical protein